MPTKTFLIPVVPATWRDAEVEGRIETGEGIAIMNGAVTPDPAIAISNSLNDRHLHACPALALLILLWIDLNRGGLLARHRIFMIIGGRIVLDLPHPVAGTHIHLGRLTGTAQVLCEMSPRLAPLQNGSEPEVHPLVDEVAHSHSAAPRSVSMEIDVSIARHPEVGVGFQGAVRLGDVPLVGDEIAVVKTATVLGLRENDQDHLYGREDLIHLPIDGLAHPAGMSTVIGILEIILGRHLGIRRDLHIQERPLFRKLALTME